MPKASDFGLVETDRPEPADGQFVVRAHYCSVDPYMRGLMRGASSYARRFRVGDVIAGAAVGTIVRSRHSAFDENDMVLGNWGWQDYGLSNGEDVRRVDTLAAPMSTALGVLGMTGLTAYFGLLEIGRPEPGQTVFVTAAAGAVGNVVGQIAKLKGCRVAGEAGSDEKVRFLRDDLHFDAAFNYRTDADYLAKIKESCPNGIDVFFDNVGGPVSDAAFANLAVGARVVLCGQIDQYNAAEAPQGPRVLWRLVTKQARAQGFLVFQFADRYDAALSEMGGWLADGKLVNRETVTVGLENAPKAFIGLFTGANIGKAIVKVSEETDIA
jgi:hypothetical protein